MSKKPTYEELEMRVQELEKAKLELKKTREKLQGNERRFREVFENISTGIAIYEVRDGGNDFVFKDINPAGARSGQKSREEHIGKSVQEVYPGVKDMGIFDVFQDVWRTGNFAHYPISQYKDERVALWVENFVSRLPSGEVMAVYEDLTEKKKTEKELENYRHHLENLVKERTSALEAKNKELETFTYSVSHDLKAPLRGIDGYSRLLLEDYSHKLDEEGVHFLNNIRTSADQMNHLIEDLLTYSRMERQDLRFEQTDIRELIKELIFEREHEISSRDIRIKPGIYIAQMHCDRESLRQILGNLLDNAIKFTRETSGPVIEIEGTEIENMWRIMVKDNGIGFDNKFRDRIFGIFQRLHRSEDYPGTGVGLALVQKAVRRLNGHIFADSEPGHGAVFTIEIPFP